MSAATTRLIGWIILGLFAIAFGWLMFVFLSTPAREPEPTPPTDPEKCQEVKPEVPAELPGTGVSL